MGKEKSRNIIKDVEYSEFYKLEGSFKSVQVDSGGFGVSWNDDVDLSENELWTEGKDSN